MKQSGQAAHGPRKRLGLVLAALAAVLVAVQSGATTSHATSGPTWWKVDLHEHSAFSGDARADTGRARGRLLDVIGSAPDAYRQRLVRRGADPTAQ